MTIENINKMINLSLQKKKMLYEILDLNKKQRQLIEDDKLEEMGELLQNKQTIMDEIDLLDAEFLKLYNKVKEDEKIDSINHIDINKYSNLKDLKSTVESINKILEEISKIDKINTSEMKKSLKAVQQNIKNVKNGKKAYKGYNKNQSDSMIIDEKK